MERSSVFGNYRKRLSERFMSMGAVNGEDIGKMLRDVMIPTYAVTAVFVLAALSVGMTAGTGYAAFVILSAAYAGWVAVTEVPGTIILHMRLRFGEELPGYFSAVRRKYGFSGNIPEAVIDAAAGRSKRIIGNALEINEILISGDRKRKVREYVRNVHKNRFLKLFLIQAFEASEFGDTKTEDGGSLFGSNMELLQYEVVKDVYSLKKKRYMFAGYYFVAAAPVLMFPLVKKAGEGIAPILGEFYERGGKAVLFVSFIVSFFICSFIREREKGRNEGTDRSSVHAVTKFAALFDRFEGNKGMLCSFIRKTASECTVGSSVADVLLRAFAGAVSVFILSAVCLAGCGGKIAIPVMFLSACSAAAFPLAKLVLSKSFAENDKREEIKSLENVIIMERKLQSINVTQLLEDIELFASVFGKEIRECINGCQSGEKNAFRVFAEMTNKKSKDFAPISEGFAAVDEVGTEEAFADMRGNRESLERTRELVDEINSSSRKNLLDIISWIPGCLILGGYFIIPFVVSSVSEMEKLFILF